VSAAFDVQVKMVALTCCHEGCGVVFAVPRWWETKRREDHTSWYCPNGHAQHFPGKSEAEKLRERLRWAEERAAQVARDKQALEAQRRAAKGQATRLRRRIANGVCPCCKRSFQDVRRHIATKHPGYAEKEKESAA
jgi:hypothetical protein